MDSPKLTSFAAPDGRPVPFGRPLRGDVPSFDLSPNVGAWLCLAIPGSLIGFTAYLTLVGGLGADRAAYGTVLFPVVALIVSALVEGCRWTAAGLLGPGLVAVNNVGVFWRGAVRPRHAVDAPMAR